MMTVHNMSHTIPKLYISIIITKEIMIILQVIIHLVKKWSNQSWGTQTIN